MNNFQDIFENRIKLYRDDIQELIREKIHLSTIMSARTSSEI